MSSRSEVEDHPPGAAPHGVRVRPVLRLGLLAAGVFLSGCWLAIVSGPVVVSVGQTVVYVVEVFEEDPNAADPELVAEVPVGWQLLSATYQGVAGGQAVSGDGVVVQSQACEGMLGELPPGFRRWHVKASEPISGAGSGSATLEFFVDSQPSGEFDLRFVFGGLGGVLGACGSAVAMTINPQGPRFLTLLQTLFDGTPEAGGLDGPSDAAVSPDGRHLYVAAETDPSVAVFARDTTTGELTFVEAQIEGSGGVEGLGRYLAPSPDDRHLYAGGAAFSRDATTGELSFLERFSTFSGSLAASPDGRHLYHSRESGIEVYFRDETSGVLTLLDTVPQGSDGGAVTLSPDGRHLYVLDPVRLRIFSRDGTSGALTVVESPLFDAQALAISPDGAHLYAATARGLRSYDRDAATGSIGFFIELLNNLITESVAVSPDGSHVIAAGRAGAHVFHRDRASGLLTFVESQLAGGLPVSGLAGPAALAFAPGGRHLYALAPSDDALLAFETGILFVDGFESGDVAAWSSAVP